MALCVRGAMSHRTGAFRLYEFLTRTLVPVFIAGCIATGWSTCAPK